MVKATISRFTFNTEKSHPEAFGCGEPPCLSEEITELTDADTREAHEDPRIVQLVIRNVERLRVSFHQNLAIFNINLDHQ